MNNFKQKIKSMHGSEILYFSGGVFNLSILISVPTSPQKKRGSDDKYQTNMRRSNDPTDSMTRLIMMVFGNDAPRRGKLDSGLPER